MQRLPTKMREALVLCCLQGRTRDEAAAELGCTVGAVKSRLERGRELLRRALARRGLELPAALLATGLTALTAPASVSAAALQAVRGGAPRAAAAAAAPPPLRATNAPAPLFVAPVWGWCWGAGPRGRGEAAPPPPAVEAPAEQAKPKLEPQPRVDHFGDALPEGAYARFG